ncbi:MAG TPA: Mth938-like domain-containing protein [Gammaproteobacteria bacterium]|nr:Mth938-like domain-containing protein [Gammaproteobacteria bacterium]
MLLRQDKNLTGNIVRSYTPGKIVINATTYTQSVVLSPSLLIEHWSPQNIMQLKAEDLQVLVEQNPEVVLLGTGEKQYFPEVETLVVLIKKGVGFEIMDTAAACRTYNLLMSEGRNVVAGLVIQ